MSEAGEAMDRIGAFCDRAIPKGVNPPPDVWRFVCVLRLKAAEKWMEQAGVWS